MLNKLKSNRFHQVHFLMMQSGILCAASVCLPFIKLTNSHLLSLPANVTSTSQFLILSTTSTNLDSVSCSSPSAQRVWLSNTVCVSSLLVMYVAVSPHSSTDFFLISSHISSAVRLKSPFPHCLHACGNAVKNGVVPSTQMSHCPRA